jgi:hypothetical protein
MLPLAAVLAVVIGNASCAAGTWKPMLNVVHAYPSRGQDCSAGLRTDISDPVDPTRYAVVGTAIYPEAYTPALAAMVQHLACDWGGDGYFIRQAVGPSTRNGGLADATVFIIIRKMVDGESSPEAERLGITAGDLKRKVGFDQDCPVEKIQIVRQREERKSGDYVIIACGNEFRYRRIDTVYEPITLPQAPAPVEVTPTARPLPDTTL